MERHTDYLTLSTCVRCRKLTANRGRECTACLDEAGRAVVANLLRSPNGRRYLECYPLTEALLHPHHRRKVN